MECPTESTSAWAVGAPASANCSTMRNPGLATVVRTPSAAATALKAPSACTGDATQPAAVAVTEAPNMTPAASASFRGIRRVSMGAPRSQRAGGVGPLWGDPLATLDLDGEDALGRWRRLVLDEGQ